ncbi:MAG: hypothetical protein MUO38_09170 [Anaerolineales bacterium]|nr:hypothetical protein [Anaerolineales bacterium]
MSITFRWVNVADGCVPEKTLGQIAEGEGFTSNVKGILTGPGLAMESAYAGLLERCHTYYWRVRARIDGGDGPWSEGRRFRILPQGGLMACLDVQAAIGKVKVNAACRAGPGTAYPIGAYAAAGEEHPVEGRNTDGTWYMLKDLGCSIGAGMLEFLPQPAFPTTELIGDLLPILPDPPLPTSALTEEPKGASCRGDLLTKADCEAAGGAWMGVGTNPQCQCP